MQRRGMVYLLCALLGSALPIGARADGPDSVSFLDNLFLHASGGGKKPAGDDSTPFGSVGWNWGIPLTPNSEGIAIGVQAGGDVTFVEHNEEWDATAGVFARNLRLGEEQVAAAVLMDYQHTAIGNDLFAVRPVLGITLGARDEIGLSGTIALNRRTKTITITTIREEAAYTSEAFFNHFWSESLATELAAGYQYYPISEPFVRGQVVWGITQYVDLALAGAVNAAGNYSCGLRMSFNFGGTGRHDTLNNIYARTKKDNYTPFPKREYGGPMGGLNNGPVATSIGGGGGGGFP